jgi:hypothetical protein
MHVRAFRGSPTCRPATFVGLWHKKIDTAIDLERRVKIRDRLFHPRPTGDFGFRLSSLETSRARGFTNLQSSLNPSTMRFFINDNSVLEANGCSLSGQYGDVLVLKALPRCGLYSSSFRCLPLVALLESHFFRLSFFVARL